MNKMDKLIHNLNKSIHVMKKCVIMRKEYRFSSTHLHDHELNKCSHLMLRINTVLPAELQLYFSASITLIQCYDLLL